MSSDRHDISREALLAEIIINETDAFIYISDPQTYDMLYLNAFGKKQLGLSDIERFKCYRLLQGKEAPCSFCNNHLLTTEEFYTWEHFNEPTGRNFLLKDKLILWQGRPARLEIAVDITEKESTSRAVRDKLEMQRALVDCLSIFYAGTTFDEAINAILCKLGQLHQADRAYVFEYSTDKQGQPVLNNTHEWCAAGVKAQIDNLQNLPKAIFADWNELFDPTQNIIIRDLEDIRESHPLPYDFLKQQQIRGLMISQLVIDDAVTGFIGVDNPRHLGDDLSLLWSLAYFVTMEQKKRTMEEQLRHMSCHDSLTGLLNRHSYNLLLQRLDKVDLTSTGVLFADLNGLKKINDSVGHEEGDRFINSVSQIISRHFRKEELFRIGGDEFVAVCLDIPEDLFHEKVRALRREVEALHPKALALGSVWRERGGRLEEMIALADQAMYAHKKEHHLRGR